MHTTDSSPTGPAAFGVIAERFRRAGQPDKAATLCREGLEKFPDHLSARVTLGWSLLDMGEFQEAFDQLKSVLKRAPDNLAAIRGLAELHERGIGLVFDAMPEADYDVEMAGDIDPVMDGDLDPIMEPEQPVIAAAALRPEPDFFEAQPAPFEIEDMMPSLDPSLDDEALPGSMFDISGVLDAGPAPVASPGQASVRPFQPEPVTQFATGPDRPRKPVSMFERAPLALRDESDLEREGELHDWLSRIRGRQSDSVSEYMAG